MIAFYADIGPRTGLGHVRRCQALAEAMTAQRPVFLAPTGEAARLLRQLGLRVQRWSPTTRFELLIVDSYMASLARWRSLRRSAKQLVALNDGARVPVSCDWIINTGITAGEVSYQSSPCNNFLLGPRFHLMRREMRKPQRARRTGQPQRLLITLGGSPNPRWIRAAVKAARIALPKAQLRVTATRPPGGLSADYLGARTDMRKQLRWCDSALSAGGQTLYDLAHAGVPTVAFSTAANQKGNVEGLARAGALLSAGSSSAKQFPRKLAAQLKRTALSAPLRRRLSTCGQNLIDGKGATRVARVLQQEAL
jgi:UDP-2,4-diacetamido-2,4,6-trideoxy-beta-L-altropyranose hydrolase